MNNKFEYQLSTLCFDHGEMLSGSQDVLKELGDAGWEMFSASKNREGDWDIWLKRRKE